MFRKLKSQLFANQTEKRLLNASIDKTHDFVLLNNLIQFPQLLQNPKSKNQLLNFLHKALSQKSNILVLKSLVLIHYCIRQKFDEELSELLINLGNDQEEKQLKTPQQNLDSNTEVFIKDNIINFYRLYLQKVCVFKQSYEFVKKYINTKKFFHEEVTNHDQTMLMICHGFKILNLSHFIFQSQEAFNKMGRYYIEFQEITSVFVQLLLDFNIFNQYINRTVTKIILKYSYNQPSYKTKKDLKLNEIKLKKHSDKAEQNLINQNIEKQETTHYFLYVSQCQKVSDRLYQYYHNRYYYKLVKTMMKFPSFLVLRGRQYKELMSRTKKVDKRLVHLVKMSKYQKPSSNSFSRTKNDCQQTINNHNKTESYDRGCKQIQYSQNKTEIEDKRSRQMVGLTLDQDQQLEQQEDY